jgi:toxin ParE1/3/4
MRLVITRRAGEDLAAIRRYIQADSPRAADAMSERILRACSTLLASPERGRPGERAGTRELTTIRPYVVVYRVRTGDVQILRIWHGAQDRR